MKGSVQLSSVYFFHPLSQTHNNEHVNFSWQFIVFLMLMQHVIKMCWGMEEESSLSSETGINTTHCTTARKSAFLRWRWARVCILPRNFIPQPLNVQLDRLDQEQVWRLCRRENEKLNIKVSIYTFRRDTQCCSTDCLLMLRCQLYVVRSSSKVS